MSLTVRREQFEYPEGTNVCWTPLRRELACVTNSVSLMMPYLEPYVVRSVAASAKVLESELDAASQAELRQYLQQETQHHIQHKKYNDLLRARYPKLSWLEKLAKPLFGSWLGRRSEKFNLAMSAAFEAFAYSIARWTADNSREIFDGADPYVASLFKWHMAEEVEHKSVVHSLWKKREGSRLSYFASCVTVVALTAFFVLAGTAMMLVYERRILNPFALLRLARWAITFAFEFIPTLALSMYSDFDPEKLVDPVLITNWLTELDLTDTNSEMQPHSSSRNPIREFG